MILVQRQKVSSPQLFRISIVDRRKKILKQSSCDLRGRYVKAKPCASLSACTELVEKDKGRLHGFVEGKEEKKKKRRLTTERNASAQSTSQM